MAGVIAPIAHDVISVSMPLTILAASDGLIAGKEAPEVSEHNDFFLVLINLTCL